MRARLAWVCFLLVPFHAMGSGEAPLKLEKTRIRVGGVPLVVEIARTREQQVHGLMGRERLSDERGMLFIYEEPQSIGFWMKNVKIPLDLGFFDAAATLLEVQTMALDPKGIADDERRRYRSAKPAKYFLEVNAGWFARHKVKPGAKLEWSEPASEKKSKK